MKRLYQTPNDLKKRCQQYFKSHKYWTPRHFLFYLKINSYVIRDWKKYLPKHYDLVIYYKNKILSRLEQMILYEQFHPKIKAKNNVTGIIFILRAWDRETYIPELKEVREVLKKEQIKIVFNNESKNRLPSLENYGSK